VGPTLYRSKAVAGEPVLSNAAGESAGDPTAGETVRSKPTLAQLQVDPADLDWRRSGTGAGSLEVAFVRAQPDTLADHVDEGTRADWVVLRVVGDPDGRVLVYDRTEWMCFLDGVGRGEFG
jgi:hypothetical protein